MSKLKFENKKVIKCQDWDKLVVETYGRPYCFQQQWGCQSRGNVHISISKEKTDDSHMPDSIPEVVNGKKMGVKFSAWLARDPKQPMKNQEHDYELELFWERNFYPELEVVANDMCRKGLIEPGDYTINIDW